ncbi:Translation initiation factor 3 subunit b [Ptychographa xylographoides]|nr:Translation initiation factor 3 subunit b [Ptychographa xylographoides]
MCCSFVPSAFFQSIAEDESISDGVRQEAQNQADSITRTLTAAAEAARDDTKVKTRYTEIPNGFTEFTSKIWGMAARNFEEINPKTGEVLGTSYQPLPGILYSSSQDPPYEQDPDVITCMEALRTTYNFYKTVFKRNSVDDHGLQLEASIHYSIRYGNAIWEPQSRQMVLGDGDGNSRFGRFAGFFKPGSMVANLDIIAHEYTHGVTQHTANLVYLRQSGALNESISDVFGCMVVQWKRGQTVQEADWLLGANIVYPNSESLEGFMRQANSLRSMKDPSAKTNLFPQPDSMKHPLYYNGSNSWDHGGVHRNSGVPNFAFYKVAMALGGHSWDEAGPVWYAALTDTRLGRQSQFVDFAKLTVEHAENLYPKKPAVAQIVMQAWKDVAVL